MDEVDLQRLRRDYQAAGLNEVDLPTDPMTLFDQWLGDAVAAALAEANAMVVSTVGADGRPSNRLVLCKQADARGFVFFTNYGSRKARELDANSNVSLLFPWHPLGRQVRVEGIAARVDRAESEAYFSSRPRGAQIGAWASEQSSVVPDRAALEQRVAELTEQYADRDVPCPPHWGGVRVAALSVEFWQGRPDRVHDRLVYQRRTPPDTAGTADSAAGWDVVRLAP